MRLGLLVMLVACGAPKGTAATDATFRIFYPDAPATGFPAVAGKRFAIKAVGQCVYSNGRDARWAMTGARIDGGELPAGLTLEDGAIAGTPTEAGSRTVRVRFSGVTCAGKTLDAQLVEITINVSAKKR